MNFLIKNIYEKKRICIFVKYNPSLGKNALNSPFRSSKDLNRNSLSKKSGNVNLILKIHRKGFPFFLLFFYGELVIWLLLHDFSVIIAFLFYFEQVHKRLLTFFSIFHFLSDGLLDLLKCLGRSLDGFTYYISFVFIRQVIVVNSWFLVFGIWYEEILFKI